MEAVIEKIPTGLTRNYVSYWTVEQALKEAMQNIAYGVMKSGIPPKLFEYNGMMAVEDYYKGFEKRHLYIGESEQRHDEDGLGNFGEGWKIFLLVMAREGIGHRVDTVGFSFFGTMEPTPHGTDVLMINVIPNDRQVGTMVVADVSYEQMKRAMESFAVLSGISDEYTKESSIIPHRNGELWVNGVRIENEHTTNPLDLYYAYNLKNRELLNRDRSQVDVEVAYFHIAKLIFNKAFTSIDVYDYVKKAMNGFTQQDIVRGPKYDWDIELGSAWRAIICEAHGCAFDKLVRKSNNQDVNKEAVYRGFTLCELPTLWNTFLDYIGIPKADDVVKLKPKLEKEMSLTKDQLNNLAAAKRNAKRALGLKSVNELPKIMVVKRIEEAGYEHAIGTYDHEEKTIYLRADILKDKEKATRTLIHEAIHWQTGAGDNTPEFTSGFEKAILRLLGF